jgi:5-enolpyruvylshikimate-3-phosphate synthase
VFADSPTRIRGVGFIRAKESDRLGDLCVELRRLGADAEDTEDGCDPPRRAARGASAEHTTTTGWRWRSA